MPARIMASRCRAVPSRFSDWSEWNWVVMAGKTPFQVKFMVIDTAAQNITFFQLLISGTPSLSRQSEKFLIGQSRKFLLTAVRLKDGTNRDEPTGTSYFGATLNIAADSKAPRS